jgi:hypothetical protein
MNNHVIVVWDKHGKFFQTWTGELKDSDPIKHGIKIAKRIKGSYKIVGNKK